MLLVASAVAAPGADAASTPVAASGYRMELHRFPGMRFSGLAECDGGLLLTDLAAGRIVRMDHDGALARIGPELPYGTDVIGDPTGPYRIAFDGEGLMVAQGWTPVDRGKSPYDHSLLRLGPAGDLAVLSDDFWNPFDFALDGETIHVIDAARNSLERLDSRWPEDDPPSVSTAGDQVIPSLVAFADRVLGERGLPGRCGPDRSGASR